ncbi:putative inorganic phosphate transporter 1-3, partial [Quercus suber]
KQIYTQTSSSPSSSPAINQANSKNGVRSARTLDTARTQYYHVKAIIIAGMGFFTDAYDLFCISAVAKLLGRLYYYDPSTGKPVKLPVNVNNAVSGVALVGTLCGQLVFSYLGDKLGRKKVYGITLILMVICALCSGLSFGASAKSVIRTLCFFRFWLGFVIGGDYPLSARIMSEIVLMLGALPAILTYYWRMKMLETGRYIAIIKGNAKQAAADMGKVLDIELQVEHDKLAQFKAANNYTLFFGKFVRRHGKHLIGTMTTWFLLDIAFYSQNLTQKDIFPAMKLTEAAGLVNALTEVYKTSGTMFVVALLGTFPGYWFIVFFIERLGRFIIQLIRFFMMSVFMFVLVIKYKYFKAHLPLFALLYGLMFFFVNFSLNSTTFVLPAELFPTRVRSTCHVMSTMASKARAMVGAFGVQIYTLSGETGKIRKVMMILAVSNMLVLEALNSAHKQWYRITAIVIAVAIVGSLAIPPVSGWLSDKLGCKVVYGLTLILMQQGKQTSPQKTALAVLEALDNARTQCYRVTAIIIAGMGFSTDAYDLFCISTITKLLGRLYYYNPDTNIPGKLPLVLTMLRLVLL